MYLLTDLLAHLISGYMAVKLMYLANAVGQLFLLDAFLKIDYHLYGVHVVEQLIRGQELLQTAGERGHLPWKTGSDRHWIGADSIRGQDWSHSERFPRVTLCEFEVRHQSRVHQYVVQCALTINLFNEKLFIFVWFWYVFLALITTVNSLRWLFRSLPRPPPRAPAVTHGRAPQQEQQHTCRARAAIVC